jgi:hypothetical protein
MIHLYSSDADELDDEDIEALSHSKTVFAPAAVGCRPFGRAETAC